MIDIMLHAHTWGNMVKGEISYGVTHINHIRKMVILSLIIWHCIIAEEYC